MIINATLWAVGCLSAFTVEDLWGVNACDGAIINTVYTDYWCFSNPHPSPYKDLFILKPETLIWYHCGITVDITLIVSGVEVCFPLFFLTVFLLKFDVLRNR